MNLPLRELELPGNAGRLHRARDTRALVRELGGNYAGYHAFLAEELAKAPQRPNPDHFANIEGYLIACQRVHEIVLTEAFLRTCVRIRRGVVGRNRSVPFVDDQDRLVSAY